MNILAIGDIYSKSGREILASKLEKIIQDNDIHFIVANGENITHGKGISKKHYQFLKNLNIDVVTSGNHIFKINETFEFIDQYNDLLRPANMNEYLPGIGSYVFEKNNKKIRVTNLMGKTFMDHSNNPYQVMDQILKQEASDIHLVDFHGESSAEKKAFAWNYDGKISALFGTHTHVQTADEQILPKGTAFITDLGMTGPIDSIIGANPQEVIIKEKLGLPVKFSPSTNSGMICGVIIHVNDQNKVNWIKRIMVQ